MSSYQYRDPHVNTLRPRQHGRHFADNTFKRILLNENVIISIKISLKCVPKDPINNIPALVQIMAWRRPGDKPLSEAMMVSLLTHIYVSLGPNEFWRFHGRLIFNTGIPIPGKKILYWHKAQALTFVWPAISSCKETRMPKMISWKFIIM